MFSKITKAAVLATAIITTAVGAAATASAQGYGQGYDRGYDHGPTQRYGQVNGQGYGQGYGQRGQGYGQGYGYRQGQGYGRPQAQGNTPVAQWMCQYGIRETNPQVKLPAVLIQFQFTALRDGRAFGRGTFNEQSPIQLAGRWIASQGKFKFMGQSQTPMGVQPFEWFANVRQDGSLMYNWTSPTGKVVVIMCQRQG